jgi:alkylation response protein AidB-like acyl-CoA dehydrogenase
VKFHLDSDRIAIQDAFSGVLRDVCTPERRRASLDAAKTDDALWTALMNVGLGGLWAPEALGGAGLGALEMALAMQAIGAHAAPGPYVGHVLAVRAVCECDDLALKGAWLHALITGARKAAFLCDDGWAPQTWSATVEGATVTGQFGYAPGATEADVFLVGARGGALLIVEADAPGVTVTPLDPSDRSRPIAQVSLKRARAHALSGAGGDAIFDLGLVMMAADALGGAQTCLEMSVDYAKTREQFGMVIGQFQALKHQLANMALEVEPARALVWYAAHALDARLPDASRAAAHAKAHLADRFVSVARASVQAHGGIGYTWDYDLQIWFRRSLFDRAYLGAPSLHRERAAAMAGW